MFGSMCKPTPWTLHNALTTCCGCSASPTMDAGCCCCFYRCYCRYCRYCCGLGARCMQSENVTPLLIPPPMALEIDHNFTISSPNPQTIMPLEPPCVTYPRPLWNARAVYNLGMLSRLPRITGPSCPRKSTITLSSPLRSHERFHRWNPHAELPSVRHRTRALYATWQRCNHSHLTSCSYLTLPSPRYVPMLRCA
jgi:hypothetical protein